MSDTTQKIRRLRELHRLETQEELDEAGAILDDFADEQPEDEHLIELLHSFYDDTEDKETIWLLVHVVEHFEKDLYYATLLKALPGMMERAPDWARLLH